MIIVIGTVVGTAETVDELVRLGLEHVERSRAEPGCLHHSVHRDVEDPNRLVFLEKWADMSALLTHFAVPASGEYVRKAQALATAPAVIEIYDSTAVRP